MNPVTLIILFFSTVLVGLLLTSAGLTAREKKDGGTPVVVTLAGVFITITPSVIAIIEFLRV